MLSTGKMGGGQERYYLDKVAARWEVKANERIFQELEEKLRPMTPKERLRFFVPYPGGPAEPPWMLDGLRAQAALMIISSTAKLSRTELTGI